MVDRMMKIAGWEKATTNEPQPEVPQLFFVVAFFIFPMVCTRGSWCHPLPFLALWSFCDIEI